MSFQLPSVKPKPQIPTNKPTNNEGSFGVPDLMLSGLGALKSNTAAPHPLIDSEKNYFKNKHDLNMSMLRNIQGLHAPLRITMELNAVKKVGHLPFLPSHNVMLDSLTGRDIEITPEDIFNTDEFREVMGQPHAVVERRMGLL